MSSLKIKRGSYAQLVAAAAADQLKEGEPYLISDQGRIAIGTSTSTFEVFAKLSEAEAAEKLSKDALARANYTAQTLANMPTVISGRAPCLKTGSLNLTRIYFPRPFATVPDVVPGIYDFGGNQRLVTMVGLTAEYVDLITNYWHSGNTFTYIAIGRLAD